MKITQIPVNQLQHHPDNPRDEYDIDDLVESVKENGILQPLTVVQKSLTLYYVVAGNRRLEAAMAADLGEVPCIVSKMDEKEQATIMLIENMQRKNLTPYEEGKGVQMCLDLGMTEADLAKKTGFSKDTIRHRKKLSELDQDKLKEKCKDGQISMQDLIKLEQIKDPEAKNKILESIGTNNFNFEIQNALSAQERQKKMTAIRLKLETFAEEMPEDWADSEFEVKVWGVPESFEIPEDADERDYVFIHQYPGKSYESFKLYARKIEEEEDEDDEPQEIDTKWSRLNTMRDKFRVINEAFKSTRQEYVVTHASAMNAEDLLMWCGYIFLSDEFDYAGPDEKIYDLPAPFQKATGTLYTNLSMYAELTGSEFNTEFNGSPRGFNSAMTIMIYTALENLGNMHADYNGVYKENDPDADILYNFLDKLGYIPSDAEKQMLDGTHKYYKEASEIQEEF